MEDTTTTWLALGEAGEIGPSELHLRDTAIKIKEAASLHWRKRFARRSPYLSGANESAAPDRWFRKNQADGALALLEACDALGIAPALTARGEQWADAAGIDLSRPDPLGSVDIGASGDEEAPEEQEESGDDTGFPVEDAWCIADMVRKASETGEVIMEFGPRKLMLWGRAFLLLRAEGYSRDKALAGAFHFACVDKEYGEEARFLREAYHNVMGDEAKAPAPQSNPGDLHPCAALAECMVGAGIPVWFHGPPGCGKTHAAHAIADRLGRPVVRIQGTGDATVDDLLGGFAATNGSTHFEYGPLPRAMRDGAVLVIDEISAFPPEVLFELQAILERGRPDLVIKKNRGEKVPQADGFTVVACDNTRGLGEGLSFAGTHKMNEAFRDRFLFVEFTHLSQAQETRVVRNVLDEYARSRGWK